MSDIEAIKFVIGNRAYPMVKLRNRDTCLVCSRKLTKSKSKKRGMGPVCWKKWNPPDEARQIFPHGFLVPKWVLKSPRFEQEETQTK